MISIAQGTIGSSPFPRPKPSAKTGEVIRVISSKIGAPTSQDWLVRGSIDAVNSLKKKATSFLTRSDLTSSNEAALVLSGLSQAALSRILSKVDTKEGKSLFTTYPIQK
jgi:hypothetical protein